MKRITIALTLMLLSACGTGSQTVAVPSATTPSTEAASPSPTPVAIAHVISGVGGLAVVSPDGKWIATREAAPSGKVQYTPAALIYDLDGKLIRRIEAPGGSWAWMPDSSGLFVALDAPQRSSLLGIADIGGAEAKATGLQMAHATLSHDGKWVIAEHQEGCCASVTTPQIWMAPRSGGAVKTLVAARNNPKGLSLLGIDSADRVVYREGTQVLRVALTGGTPLALGTITGSTMTVGADTSPDGTVILVRDYEPLRWYVVANDRVTPWADAVGAILEDYQGERKLFGTAALWIAPHTLLVRTSSGDLSSFDALAGLAMATKARLGPSDVVLAHDRGRLLVARGKTAVVIDLATGRESDAGMDSLDSDGARASRASALPGGGFILSTITATYRID